MKTSKIIVMVIFFMCSLPLLVAQNMKSEIKTIDSEVLARKLVTQCAGINEGDLVLISGGKSNIELLENIFINVRKLGAFPLLTLGSDKLTHQIFTEVPEKYDTQVPEMEMKLTGVIDAVISVNYNEDPALLNDVAPERLVKINKSYQPVNELARKRNLRTVTLGNGLYPTEAQAKLFGISLDELSELFWKGVNTDYMKLESTGKAVKNVLASGKEVRITNNNGTDFKVQIGQRPVFVSDGVISEEDKKLGFAAMQNFLPAGEVYESPVPGTAEGRIVVDRFFVLDKEIQGLTLNFQKGKLTSMTAKSGLESFSPYYDSGEPGKEEFAFIDLGINSDVSIKPGSKVVAWMPAGMITVGIGNNIWAGGENNNPSAFSFFLPGCTLTVDGKVLVENGTLRY